MCSPPSSRFLERKRGKELCAKLRFASAPVEKGLGKRNRLPRLWAFLFRRGGYHPPALLGCKRVRGDFAFGRVSFSSLRKKPKNRRGNASGKTLRVFMPHPPRTPYLIYGGAIKGQGYIHPARAKNRIPLLAPPAAAPCLLNRSVLLQELSRLAFSPRWAVPYGGEPPTASFP